MLKDKRRSMSIGRNSVQPSNNSLIKIPSCRKMWLIMMSLLVVVGGLDNPSHELRPGALFHPLGTVLVTEDTVNVGYNFSDLFNIPLNIQEVADRLEDVKSVLEEWSNQTAPRDPPVREVMQIQKKKTSQTSPTTEHSEAKPTK